MPQVLPPATEAERLTALEQQVRALVMRSNLGLLLSLGMFGLAAYSVLAPRRPDALVVDCYDIDG
jgi:hypothetical protein